MNKEVIDLNEFLERVQDDKELLVELLEIFTEDYNKKRLLIAEAIEKKDYDEVRGIAHSLKGASGNISAHSLRELMFKLEEKGGESNLDGADDILKRVDEVYSDLSLQVEEIKKKFEGQI